MIAPAAGTLPIDEVTLTGSSVKDVHQIVNQRWLNGLLKTHLPLSRLARVGSEHSWQRM